MAAAAAAAAAKAGAGGESAGPLRVVYSDAPKALQDELVAAAGRALRAQAKGETRYLHEVAAQIREDAAKLMPGAWHVFVGQSFGSFVTHEAGTVSKSVFGVGRAVPALLDHVWLG